MIWLRWLMVVPISLLAVACVLLVDLAVTGQVVRYLCPPDQYLDNVCLDAQVQNIYKLLNHVFLCLSVVAIVASSFLAAPVKDPSVAWWALLVTSIMIISFDSALNLSLAAIGAGLLTAIGISSFNRRKRNASNSMPPE